MPTSPVAFLSAWSFVKQQCRHEPRAVEVASFDSLSDHWMKKRVDCGSQPECNSSSRLSELFDEYQATIRGRRTFLRCSSQNFYLGLGNFTCASNCITSRFISITRPSIVSDQMRFSAHHLSIRERSVVVRTISIIKTQTGFRYGLPRRWRGTIINFHAN